MIRTLMLMNDSNRNAVGVSQAGSDNESDVDIDEDSNRNAVGVSQAGSGQRI